MSPYRSSYTSSNTEPGRWAKIVAGADSGRHPEIMIDDGKLVAVSIPSVADARIQSFLADVFKDGDNEWFRPDNDPVKSTQEKAAKDGQPGSSKSKKISLTQQRANARQEKKDRGEGVKARAEMTKEGFNSQQWSTICTKVRTLRPAGVFCEGGKVVATDNNVGVARQRLQGFVAFVLGQDPSLYGVVVSKGQGLMLRRP